TATSTITIQSSVTPTINFANGFTSTAMQFNGFAKLNGTRLQLTDGGSREASSAWFTTPVNVQSFTNDFSFQLTNANSDGMTLTMTITDTTTNAAFTTSWPIDIPTTVGGNTALVGFTSATGVSTITQVINWTYGP